LDDGLLLSEALHASRRDEVNTMILLEAIIQLIHPSMHTHTIIIK
jgi:hypothetical protein